MSTPSDLDVLLATRDRPGALAVTLAGLAAQTVPGFRVVVSDQSREPVAADRRRTTRAGARRWAG
ncbi:hypothetical protein AB0C10_23550 [Microbispora amethystogenes]|uniref:hypothetical protein n=1 Tax=Microbispora amethystogenes TaxID=1427754 RepID=UPI0033CC415A